MLAFFDLEVLRIVWWLILGVLFIGFTITDGFDLGVAILFPFITRNEEEKRIVLNTIGPFWEGNQVWIIVGAGAILAAWPMVYAAAFSSFYFLILILLLTLGISRPVSFKYRSKLPHPLWRTCWDHLVFIGGLVPAFIFGILAGNVITGIPFQLDESLRLTHAGSEFFALFHPFSLCCGVLAICMVVMHGGLYLIIKTESHIADRAAGCARFSAILLVPLFIVLSYWVTFHLKGYVVTSELNHFAPSNPLHKTVISEIGAWANNYFRYPILWLIPAVGMIGPCLAMLFSFEFPILAFLCSSFSIAGIIGTFGVGLYPFMLPSSTQFNSSLLVFDASSSHMTLLIMLCMVALFLPLVLLYTSWVHYVMRGKVNEKELASRHHNHSAS